MRALDGVDAVQTNHAVLVVIRVKPGPNRWRESCLGGFEVETSVGKGFKIAVVMRHESDGPFESWYLPNMSTLLTYGR